MARKDLKIVVIYGGISTEREVSLRSGRAVYEALKKGGFENTELFDLTAESLKELFSTPCDVAFLALHGKGGEDGAIQGALELCGIPYTGSGIEASAVCMNKIRTKEIISSLGLPTPAFVRLHRDCCEDVWSVADELILRLGLPQVIKAPDQGSSIGVFIVKDREGAARAVEDVFKLGDELLAEEFSDGIELTLPIVGNRALKAFPAIEITSENEFYDYQSKYTEGMCHHIIPARLPEEVLREVERIGMEAYSALGCEGLSRIDFIVDRQKGPMIIEVNTLPGMTAMSLFPDAARSVGVSFEELVETIVDLALEKEENRAKQKGSL